MTELSLCTLQVIPGNNLWQRPLPLALWFPVGFVVSLFRRRRATDLIAARVPAFNFPSAGYG